MIVMLTVGVIVMMAVRLIVKVIAIMAAMLLPQRVLIPGCSQSSQKTGRS